MPHRINQITTASLWVIDGIMISLLSLVALIDSIKISDLTGPSGFLIGTIAVIVVMWKNGNNRDKIFMETTERHHLETMAANKEHNVQIAGLTSESIKASFVVAGEIKSLKAELAKRPCCADLDEK